MVLSGGVQFCYKKCLEKILPISTKDDNKIVAKDDLTLLLWSIRPVSPEAERRCPPGKAK